MNVIVIGTGFVGATHAAVLAAYGHSVTAYDINKERIADLASKDPKRIDAALYEPGLAKLVTESTTLTFTRNLFDLAPLLDTTPVIFLCLPTPAHELTLPDEQKFLFTAATQLAELLKKRNDCRQTQHALLATKSTVPIGTAAKLKKHLALLGITNFSVASNPEFLVEGKAVEGSKHPDRIVIGIETPADEKLLRELYFAHDNIIAVSPSDAEAIKLLANFELFSTIVRTFQVAGRACELIPGLTYENVIKGITADKRIPLWGHHVSLYAGGSCFEKDAYNLLHTLSGKNNPHTEQFIRLTIDSNTAQLDRFYQRAHDAGFTFKDKTVALLGTAFKQDTNDVRMSPALPLTGRLIRDGAQLRVYDPQALQNYLLATKAHTAKITACTRAEDAITGSDTILICTDWPEFKNLAPAIIKEKPRLIMDGRRSLREHYESFAAAGITVIAVGSPTITAT
ncbi:UDP-glucose/GDP-mannose dehydrogenase family protein [Candidatus Woesearchaeota archaeon]|nr:MAG: UDP-glucose/GDP-mannose dehydrogenase family protein [Candidatus Woesearchaeota archaeon]